MAIVRGATSSNKVISVEDFIALRSTDDITYYNYSILQYLNGFDMFITNLLYDYEEELQDVAVTIQLTDIEKYKYRYKPYLLAYDLYKSTETAFIIMMLNGIIDPKEFNFDRVKVLKPNELTKLLGRIQSINSEFINDNRSKLNTDFTNNTGNSIWTE